MAAKKAEKAKSRPISLMYGLRWNPNKNITSTQYALYAVQIAEKSTATDNAIIEKS